MRRLWCMLMTGDERSRLIEAIQEALELTEDDDPSRIFAAIETLIENYAERVRQEVNARSI